MCMRSVGPDQCILKGLTCITFPVLQQLAQAGSSDDRQNDSDVSLHQVESHLLGSAVPEIRCTGIVAHRDYYILHRGTVLKHGDREDAYVKVLLLNGELVT